MIVCMCELYIELYSKTYAMSNALLTLLVSVGTKLFPYAHTSWHTECQVRLACTIHLRSRIVHVHDRISTKSRVFYLLVTVYDISFVLCKQ